MRSTERTITTEASKELVINELRQLPEGKWTVKIYPWAQKRTTALNRLMWMWLTEIGEAYKMDAEEMHAYFKEKYLLNILYRDDPSFARMSDAIKNVKGHSRDDYHLIKKQVTDLVSTTGLSVKQMVEYLNKIKMFAHHEGVNITIPPDKEWEFMCGIKKGKANDRRKRR